MSVSVVTWAQFQLRCCPAQVVGRVVKCYMRLLLSEQQQQHVAYHMEHAMWYFAV